MYCTPGPDNSNLIRTENAVPSKPENKAKIKYKVPISLALEDRNQRSNHSDITLCFLSLCFSSSLFTNVILPIPLLELYTKVLSPRLVVSISSLILLKMVLGDVIISVSRIKEKK